jgi:hypothetical protein
MYAHVDRGSVWGWETSTQRAKVELSTPGVSGLWHTITITTISDRAKKNHPRARVPRLSSQLGYDPEQVSKWYPNAGVGGETKQHTGQGNCGVHPDNQSACVRACVCMCMCVCMCRWQVQRKCGVESVPAFPRACVCICDDAPVWSCCAPQDACRCYPHGHDAVLLSGSLAVGSSLRCHSARSSCAQAFTHARQNNRRLNVAVRSTRLILASPSKPSRQTVCTLHTR